MVTPTSLPRWRRRSGWASRWAWPGVRWRTSPARKTIPSTVTRSRPNVSRRRRRPPTKAPSGSCSPPAPRTTCTDGPTWRTRSRGSRPTRSSARTSCSLPACATSPTSARWSARWTARSTCSAPAARRPCQNWPRRVWPGSRWAARSRSPRSAPSLPRPPNYVRRAPTATRPPARPGGRRPSARSASRYTCGSTSDAISSRCPRSCRSSTCR